MCKKQKVRDVLTNLKKMQNKCGHIVGFSCGFVMLASGGCL